ncbi:phosphatase PAP2 family protein [Massilia sp. TS11]|uniref:phosphatase PAP2 family protein n=1 Tax=Massilia sp. TS11 TaxID=2908003 RepID=UPI001EDC12FE|nr:phosphatase PAP2 family protein [Massilia sp. TS11]MCG2585421.1 phosphatase PAP2 family protein [Massilia sp. TS11]
MNTALFFWIHQWRGEWLDRLVVFGSVVGEAWNGLILLAVLLLVPRWRVLLRSYVPAYALMGALSLGMKRAFAMPRPPQALGAQVHPVGPIPDSFSFPSGHAMFAAMLLTWLWPLATRGQRALLLGWALFIGFARVNVGAHFPVDVAAGWLIGGLVGWAVQRGKSASGMPLQ